MIIRTAETVAETKVFLLKRAYARPPAPPQFLRVPGRTTLVNTISGKWRKIPTFSIPHPNEKLLAKAMRTAGRETEAGPESGRDSTLQSYPAR
jgi:hypothetical protein